MTLEQMQDGTPGNNHIEGQCRDFGVYLNGKPNGQIPDTDMGELWDIMEMKWPLVVEDVKSRATRTKEYVMKRKMMKSVSTSTFRRYESWNFCGLSFRAFGCG